MNVTFKDNEQYIPEPLYQWDLNQVLKIIGLDIPVAPVIHFSNRKSKEALLVQSSMNNGEISCPIPNILLKNAYAITCDVSLMSDQKATTVTSIEIPVRPRVMPSDYLYTDNVPILTYEAIEADINTKTNAVYEYAQTAMKISESIAKEYTFTVKNEIVGSATLTNCSEGKIEVDMIAPTKFQDDSDVIPAFTPNNNYVNGYYDFDGSISSQSNYARAFTDYCDKVGYTHDWFKIESNFPIGISIAFYECKNGSNDEYNFIGLYRDMQYRNHFEFDRRENGDAFRLSIFCPPPYDIDKVAETANIRVYTSIGSSQYYNPISPQNPRPFHFITGKKLLYEDDKVFMYEGDKVFTSAEGESKNEVVFPFSLMNPIKKGYIQEYGEERYYEVQERRTFSTKISEWKLDTQYGLNVFYRWISDATANPYSWHYGYITNIKSEIFECVKCNPSELDRKPDRWYLCYYTGERNGNEDEEYDSYYVTHMYIIPPTNVTAEKAKEAIGSGYFTLLLEFDQNVNLIGEKEEHPVGDFMELVNGLKVYSKPTTIGFATKYDCSPKIVFKHYNANPITRQLAEIEAYVEDISDIRDAVQIANSAKALSESVDTKVESNYLNAPLPQTSLPLTKKTLSGKLKDVSLVGRCVQNGTPTPSSPIEIEYAKEDDKITSVGKNLFDKDSAQTQKILNDSGEVVSATWETAYASDFITVKSGATVTFSYKRKEGYNYSRICQYDKDKIFIGLLSKDTDTSLGKKSYTVTVSDNARYIIVSATINADDIMVEYGTSVTDYVAYTHAEISLPCDLLGLPNAQDEYKNGKVTRRVGKCAIPSNIDWALSNGCFQTASAFPSNLGSKQEALCDMLKLEYYASAITSNLDNGCFGWNNEGKLTVRVDGIATVEAFKSWLNSATPMLIYVLATSTTSTTLPLEEIPTYAEQTTISCDYIELSGKYPTDALNFIEKSALDVYSEEEVLVGTFLGRNRYRRMFLFSEKFSLPSLVWNTTLGTSVAPYIDDILSAFVYSRSSESGNEYTAVVPIVAIRNTNHSIGFFNERSNGPWNNIYAVCLEYTKFDEYESASQISLLSESEEG